MAQVPVLVLLRLKALEHLASYLQQAAWRLAADHTGLTLAAGNFLLGKASLAQYRACILMKDNFLLGKALILGLVEAVETRLARRESERVVAAAESFGMLLDLTGNNSGILPA
jgi:hypothetical protein